VRALGASHFNYHIHTDEKDATPDTTGGGTPTPSAGSIPTPKRCKVRVTLARVDYNGNDIGDDWSYDILVEKTITKVKEHTVTHATSDHLSRLVYEDIKGHCGDHVTLDISVNITEHDAVYDDHGSRALRTSFVCGDGASYTQTLTVEAYEYWNGTAKLKFVFEIETHCVK